MKSIITSKSEKILLTVNIQQHEQQMLENIMHAHDAKLLKVTSDSGSQKLGYLLGFNGFEGTNDSTKIIKHPLAVFSGVDGNMLNLILADMRRQDIKIDLKAICTRHNQSWSLYELEQELLKEHEYMNGGEKNE